eukprot:EG_transcript_7733
MPAKRKASNNKRKQKVQKKKTGAVDEVEDEEDVLNSDDFEDPVTDEEYDSEQEAAEKLARHAKRLEEAIQSGEATSSAKLPIFHRPKQGENLVLNRKAYDMRHVLGVTWPCLSFDVVLDKEGLNRIRYPLGCTIVAGSQADDPKQCEVLMKKVGHLCRTKFDKGDSDSSSDEDEDEDEDEADEDNDEDDDADPIIYTKELAHQGSVLRIRAMRQHPGIVACWSEEAGVCAYDMRDSLQQLADPKGWIEQAAKDPKAFAKLTADNSKKAPFFQSSRKQHNCEGFALQWSTKVAGLLASGDCSGRINVWQSDAQGTSFSATQLNGHQQSVEDVQWSPTQDNVLASCSVDCSVRLWDVRDGKSPEKLKWQADVVDINVISWNENADARQFLATGSESGVIKVWDLRMVKRSDVTPIFESPFHQQSITSIEWSPINSSLLAAASSDMVTFWDFSVERDEEAAANAAADGDADTIPPQVMFIHQGVREAKEIHWHPQLPGLMICTDLDGFQFFKPTNWKSLLK